MPLGLHEVGASVVTGESPGLTADAAASSTYALTSALNWWIPGMLLVVCYTTYVYRTMPDQFSVLDTGEQ